MANPEKRSPEGELLPIGAETPSEVKSELPPAEQLTRDLGVYQKGIESNFSVPVVAETTESKPSSGPLRTAAEIAQERFPATEEEKTASAAQSAEAEQKFSEGRERRLQVLSKEILQKRLDGVISHQGIDALLAEKGIKPWTDESAKFMEQWDREQAERIYKETLNKFDAEIGNLRQRIKEAEAQIKTASTKDAKAKIEGSLLAYESKLKEIENKKRDFEIILETPKPQPPSGGPEAAAGAAPEKEEAAAAPEKAVGVPATDLAGKVRAEVPASPAASAAAPKRKWLRWWPFGER